jgi:uncharacterized protein involved in cysteine biosynthesis
MNFFNQLRHILSLKVPNWLGVLCYVLLVLTVLALAFLLLFPDWLGNFIVEHDICFLQ